MAIIQTMQLTNIYKPGDFSPVFMDIHPDEARQMLEQEDISVLDVRTPPEFAEDRLKGAINIDMYSPDFKEQLKKLDKGRKWLVYCRTASRSAYVVKLMEELGFTHIFHMLGGILEWEMLGFAVDAS